MTGIRRLLDLVHQKVQTLAAECWLHCARKILVVMMVDVSISGVTSAGSETDRPETGGFDEVWLADYTQVEAFRAVDLFALVHPTIRGHISTGDRGRKPYS
jgi:hypothetical protein